MDQPNFKEHPLNLEQPRRLEICNSILQDVLYGKRKIDHVHPLVLPASQFIPTPTELCVSRSGLPGQHYGIFSKTWLAEGTRLGPFTGKKIHPAETGPSTVNSDLMWEVLDERGRVSHLVDGSQQRPLNWLCLINSARNDTEQNLQTLQIGQQIYYQATKTIHPEEELLVWYGSYIHSYMGIPCTTPNTKIKPGHDNTSTPADIVPPTGSQKDEKIKCVICQKTFNSRSNLRSHMRTHTLEKPFICKFCLRAFSQSSTLRNHLRLHTGERPYRCDQCQSAYSQLAGLRAHQKSARHREPFSNPSQVHLGQ